RPLRCHLHPPMNDSRSPWTSSRGPVSSTIEVADHEVEAWAAEVAARHGFSDVSHTIEIFGNCADCRS
ncbi:hypothetical protein PJM31_13325, partial [Mycobacterium kansasii]